MRNWSHIAIALTLWTAAPVLADPGADFAEALRHHSGEGVLQDYARAADLLHSAAKAGHAGAQNMLGRYYFEGLGVAADRTRSIAFLETAAAAGDPGHVLDLAQVLETDPATLPRAASLYERAAAAGLADAAVSLGVLYQNGRGVPQDYARAHALYSAPAAQGHARALNNLGLLYVRAHGVEQDYERAATLFAAAAEQGLKEAMRNLGVLYENGFGVALDEARAQDLYRAAGQGMTAAPLAYRGDARLAEPQDDVRLANAAQAGDPIAQFQWALAALTAQDASFTDRRNASRFMVRTAQQGHGPSMYNLGLLYMRGIGVAQDYVLAHKWLLLAQARGVDGAADAVRQTARQMTPAQINDAQARAKAHAG
ncbi:SEL1-like repeat protein [Tateyamaria sp. SN6-1]|uniref:SEL1-like repeat protein n=1 Tax=Tateyamaria sp. SN6-1 TaxID=3092148 RepID=UPI0039F44F9B